MVGPLDTLSLAQRKFLVGRWIGVVAVGAISRAVPGAEAGDRAAVKAEKEIGVELQDVTELIQSGTIRALRDEVEEVDAYLARLGPEVADLANSGSGGGPCVRELEQRLAIYRADPVDPFEAAFKVADDVARWLYEAQGFGDELPSARCELSLDPDSRRSTGPDAAVTGALREGSTSSVVARIDFSAAKFWREEVCALTYVALHELVVHGFAADGARSDSDAFAEGWMDFVAFGLHERLAAGELPQRCPFEAEIHPAHQAHHASVAHVTRGQRSALAESGRIAAIAAQRALARDLGSRDAGQAAMWAFSAALNRSEIDSSRRSEMCELIEWATEEDKLLDAFVDAARRVEAASDSDDKIQIACEFVGRTSV